MDRGDTAEKHVQQKCTQGKHLGDKVKWRWQKAMREGAIRLMDVDRDYQEGDT